MSTITLTRELAQKNIPEKKHKQLRMCQIKRMSPMATISNVKSILIDDLKANKEFQVSYDGKIALVSFFNSTPDNSAGKIAGVLESVTGCGAALDMVSIQPQQVSFVVHGTFLTKVCEGLEKLQYRPEVIDDCVKVSVQTKSGHSLLNVVTVVAAGLAQANIPILRLTESYGLIEVLIKSSYIQQAQQVLTERNGFCGH